MKELHDVGSLGLTKLIKDSENNIIQTFTQIGSSSQVGAYFKELMFYQSPQETPVCVCVFFFFSLRYFAVSV